MAESMNGSKSPRTYEGIRALAPAGSTNVEKSDGFFLLSGTPLLTLYLTVASRERLELP
jgi:hypothetical protein